MFCVEIEDFIVKKGVKKQKQFVATISYSCKVTNRLPIGVMGAKRLLWIFPEFTIKYRSTLKCDKDCLIKGGGL